ncbi:MAG: MerR family transcriptional regulator [Myxococcales bacterium]|nr:MerR family transcriptional regulator [Myxococcota bacterium]MDW8283537.1 MerR family transcriptional regulator [Myxococcales bacterium]
MARDGDPVSEEKETRFLEEDELEDIERQNPDGLTLAQVIEAFESRGLHLSEATFRKYVQLGLLMRSRRVGRKGKHQGSMGVYPASVVRRLNTIRQMLAASYTIEEIQRSFLRFKDQIEALDKGATALLDGFERELRSGSIDPERRKGLLREISAVRKLAAELVQRIESLERQIVSPLERAARERAFGTGAAGGADDLL